eukprot:57921_1
MASITTWCTKIWIIIALTIFCYLNSLENELCFDDMFAVLYNGDTSPDKPYLPLWKHDFWGHDISSNESHKSYRPITITYFRLIRQYTLSIYNINPDIFLINNLTMREKGIHPEYIHREKDLQPIYLHIGNILIHTLNSLLIMLLVMLLFNHEKDYNNDLSFISALFFSTHPIHVEAVTGIVGAAELLSCFFGLLSFFCYTFAHSSYFIQNEYNNKKDNDTEMNDRKKPWELTEKSLKCKDCKFEELNKRRDYEKQEIRRLEDDGCPQDCALNMKWSNQWRNFVHNATNIIPSPIDNTYIHAGNNMLKEELIKDTDYLMIPSNIWTFLIEIYGGGPKIVLQQKQQKQRQQKPTKQAPKQPQSKTSKTSKTSKIPQTASPSSSNNTQNDMT